MEIDASKVSTDVPGFTFSAAAASQTSGDGFFHNYEFDSDQLSYNHFPISLFFLLDCVFSIFEQNDNKILN
jgi:hypothetical protein